MSLLRALTAGGLLFCIAGAQPRPWHDPSKHGVQFVTVQDGVRLEVLDWGGSGRSVVLLAGSGNTAHVFDEFAPKLAATCRVYGITRRGFGASSRPDSGYDDQRLAHDVLQVLDSLRIPAPVLAGHSMGGGELTTLGAQHSDRLGGLVYLDAIGDPRDFPASDPKYMELFRSLPAPMRTPPPPAGSPSFAAYRAWQMRYEGFAFPESELRTIFETNADGTKGRYRTPSSVLRAIGEGQKKRDYSQIKVPVLVLLATPGSPEDEPEGRRYQPKNDEERAAVEAFRSATITYIERWKKNVLTGVPSARIVELPGAGHMLFLTREPVVLREMQSFVARLR